MKSFSVTGCQQGDFEPQLVSSKEVTKDMNLLNVMFETNPLGKLLYVQNCIIRNMVILVSGA